MAKNQRERALDEKLISVYNQQGLKMFCQVCASMLNIRDNDNFQKKMKVNGEVCEVLLRVITEHYLKTHGIPGSVFHSLVLPNKYHPERDFRTEIDFTCLTPYVCVIAECKSFVGQITVSDECKLTRHSKKYGVLESDVGRQTDIHASTIDPYLREYVRPNMGLPEPPLQTICFMFCNGEIQDRRTHTAQNDIPVLVGSSIFSYYDLLFKRFRKEVYDVQKAEKTFQAMADSRALHIQHASYLGY